MEKSWLTRNQMTLPLTYNQRAKSLKQSLKRKQMLLVDRFQESKNDCWSAFCGETPIQVLVNYCPVLSWYWYNNCEKFVEECNVGADAWRRTGLLTFDGNVKVGKKCTYKRIQEHLQSVYNHKFLYGTLAQLCAVRNRRRLSAKHYKGVAQVTSCRARKGFMLKLNPDTLE